MSVSVSVRVPFITSPYLSTSSALFFLTSCSLFHVLVMLAFNVTPPPPPPPDSLSFFHLFTPSRRIIPMYNVSSFLCLFPRVAMRMRPPAPLSYHHSVLPNVMKPRGFCSYYSLFLPASDPITLTTQNIIIRRTHTHSVKRQRQVLVYNGRLERQQHYYRTVSREREIVPP